MADKSGVALGAAIKSLNEVILPSIDPENPLALEQAKFVVNYLILLKKQLPYRSRRKYAELGHYMRLAVTVLGHCDGLTSLAQISALSDAVTRARAESEGSKFMSEEGVDELVRGLAASISDLVRVAPSFLDAQRRAVEFAVLDAAEEWLNIQRAWFAPLGFDSEAKELPEISSYL